MDGNAQSMVSLSITKWRRKTDYIIMRFFCKDTFRLHRLAETARTTCFWFQFNADQQSFTAHFLYMRTGDFSQLLHKVFTQLSRTLRQFFITDHT